jgi:hypothetical protein
MSPDMAATLVARHGSEPTSFTGPGFRFARTAPNHPTAPPPRFLAARNARLVEDSLIISLDAEDVLGQLGAEHVTGALSIQSRLWQTRMH